jgi:DNA transformation protein
VLEQLRRIVADVRARSMFGGVGVYAGERFFALMDDDTLYLKVDDATRGRFEARGMGPFRPGGESGEVMHYYEVPGDVLEDVDLLAPWIEEAVAVAARAKRRRSER